MGFFKGSPRNICYSKILLERLSKGTEEDSLMAYQIAFDMYESATQQFLSRVLAAIKKTAPVPLGGQLVPQEGEESMETDETKEEKKEEKKEEQKVKFLENTAFKTYEFYSQCLRS